MGLILHRMMRLQTGLNLLEPKNVANAAVEIAPVNSVGFPQKAYRSKHSVMKFEKTGF